MDCERQGCNLPATYERLKADLTTRGLNLNEPGARIERLCYPHTDEIIQYVGGNIWRITDGDSKEN